MVIWCGFPAVASSQRMTPLGLPQARLVVYETALQRTEMRCTFNVVA